MKVVYNKIKTLFGHKLIFEIRYASKYGFKLLCYTYNKFHLTISKQITINGEIISYEEIWRGK